MVDSALRDFAGDCVRPRDVLAVRVERVELACDRPPSAGWRRVRPLVPVVVREVLDECERVEFGECLRLPVFERARVAPDVRLSTLSARSRRASRRSRASSRLMSSSYGIAPDYDRIRCRSRHIRANFRRYALFSRRKSLRKARLDKRAALLQASWAAWARPRGLRVRWA